MYPAQAPLEIDVAQFVTILTKSLLYIITLLMYIITSPHSMIVAIHYHSHPTRMNISICTVCISTHLDSMLYMFMTIPCPNVYVPEYCCLVIVLITKLLIYLCLFTRLSDIHILYIVFSVRGGYYRNP